MIKTKSEPGHQMAWAMLVVSVLLILTALGNAYAMLAAAIAGIVGIAFVSRRQKQNNWAAAMAAGVLAVVVVVVLTSK